MTTIGGVDLSGLLNGGVDPVLLIAGLAGVVLLLFVLSIVIDGTFEDAAERTSRTAVGASTGGAMVAVAVAAEGIQVLSEAPGLVLALLGIGGIAAGVSWPMFAAAAFVTLVVLQAVRG